MDHSENSAPSEARGGPTRDVSRRQFLAAGIAGASIGLGVPARGQSGAHEMNVGLLGAGDRGSQLLNALLAQDGVRIAAVADPDSRNRLRAIEIVRSKGRGASPLLATNAERVLELARAGKLDALVIATPPHLHREQGELALEAGLHVYLEKPMGITIADSLALRDSARRAEARGQVFQLGLQRRYNPRYLAGVDAIRGGRAGEVLFVRAQWHNTGNPSRRKGWYYQREKSGDLVLEQACHQIDACNWVYGDVPPSLACGMGGVQRFHDEPPGRSIRDHYSIDLEYPSGGKVSLSHVSFAVPDRRFSGVYELVFCERLGIDLFNGLAFDRKGKTIPLKAASGNETSHAVAGFVSHIRAGERSRAGADVGFRATAASLLALGALDSRELVAWESLFA